MGGVTHAYIIPARGGSKRLSRKNVKMVNGRPMISWAIDACKQSTCAVLRSKKWTNIFVTSEDPEIIAIAHNAGVRVIVRPEYLADDHVWTQDVLQHAVEVMKEKFEFEPEVLVRVQANSPQVTSKVIDECINLRHQNSLNEVFTVKRTTGIEDGAVHVLKRDVVFQEALSVYKGIVLTDYIDVHTYEDLQRAEARMLSDGEVRVSSCCEAIIKTTDDNPPLTACAECGSLVGV